MSARFAMGFLSAVVLGAMASAPAGAQGRYDANYDRFQSDRHEAEHHGWVDRRESSGHPMGDPVRYGTADLPPGAHENAWRQGRLEDAIYERMRELAHVLDEQAEHAADQAIEGAHHGTPTERRFLNAITHFARQAADFHERMDRYRESPWDVPEEVDHLVQDARRVERQIHNAHVFEHTWDDWDDVVDIVVRMQRVVGSGEHDRDLSLYRH